MAIDGEGRVGLVVSLDRPEPQLAQPEFRGVVLNVRHVLAGICFLATCFTDARADTALIVPNEGASADGVRFVATSADARVFFTADRVAITRVDVDRVGTPVGRSVHLELLEPSPLTKLRLADPVQTRISIFRGNDASKWQRGVQAHTTAIYENAWPGIDLHVRVEEGALRYEAHGPAADAFDSSRLLLQRGRDVADDVFRRDDVARSGKISWRSTGASRPALARSTDFRSTFLGGSAIEDESRVLLASNGDAIVIGASLSTDYPTTPGVYDPTDNDGGGWETVVTRMSSDGSTRLWSTYIGGTANDQAQRAILGAADAIWIYGSSTSSNWPTTAGAYQANRSGGYDGVVCRLSPDGTTLEYSTYIGGSQTDYLIGFDLHPGGGFVVAGDTGSTNFPVTIGSFQESYAGGPGDGFVSRFSADGSTLLASTFVGGAASDAFRAALVLDDGRVVLSGESYSSDYPATPGAENPVFLGGSTDVVLTALSSDLATLSWSTYYGGDAAEGVGSVLVLSPQGEVLVAGRTDSSSLPRTTRALQDSNGGASDAFVTSVDPETGYVFWSTFLGGTGTDVGQALTPLATGAIAVSGHTQSADFPVTASAYDATHNGGKDVFVAVIARDGSRLGYSTFIGGSGDDTGFGIVSGASERIWVSGQAEAGFPTTAGAFDESQNGGPDQFLASFTPDVVLDLERPLVTAVADVPDDQGLQVRLSFQSSIHDDAEDPAPVVRYAVYRRYDDLLARTYPEGDWDFVVELPASGDWEYNVVVPTLCDCFEGQDCSTSFFVRAITTDPFVYYNSLPLAGCSVDNLTPEAPAALVLDGETLRWDPSGAPDVTLYRVYGLESGQDVSSGVVVGETGTSAFDVTAVATELAFVTVVDDGGNESEASTIVALGGSGPTDVPRAGGRTGLAQNTPNPFNPSTVIEFSIGSRSPVELAVFDMQGRRVRTLVADTEFESGVHRVKWDGRDDVGRTVAAGVYLYRLETRDAKHVRKMVLVK